MELKELLALRENEYLIKDANGNFRPLEEGAEGTVVTSDGLDLEIFKTLFGSEKIGTNEYRTILRLKQIAEKHLQSGVVKKVRDEFGEAGNTRKRKKS